MKKYYIKDLGIGLGTFIKITDYFLPKDNSLVNIGDSFLVINFDSEIKHLDEHQSLSTIESKYQGIDKKIIIKVFEEDNSTKSRNTITYTFNPNENKVIKIGRKNHGNDIELNDTMISKTNTTIEYSDKKGWILKDGKYEKNNSIKEMKQSTNGTWVLVIDEHPITDGMIFKGHFNLFCCDFISN